MKVALALVAMLGIGIAIGFAVGSSDQEELPAAQSPTAPLLSDGQSESVVGAPSSTTSSLDEMTSAVEPQTGSVPSGTVVAHLAAALQEIPLLEVATGAGQILGTVATADGTPLAGVTVRAYGVRAMAPVTDKDYDDDPIDELVVDYVQRARHRRALMRAAVTEEDGSYRIEGLVESGAYAVSAQLDGWTFRSTDGYAHEVKPGSQVDFEAAVVVTVPLVVLSPDGARADRAVILARNGDRRYRRGRLNWSPTKPTIELSPGTYNVSAQMATDAEIVSEDQEVVVQEGSSPAPITLQLRAHPGIKGRVRFPEGEVSQYATVVWMTAPGGVPASPELLGNSSRTTHVMPHTGYKFDIPKLAPGTYSVGVRRSFSGPIVALETVDVSDAVVEVELVIPALAAQDYLAFRVYGPEGSLAKDCDLRVRYAQADGRTRSRSAQTLPQADGSLRLLLTPRNADDPNLNDGRDLTIEVISKDYGTRSVEWSPGSPRELDVHFAPPAQITVTIPGYVGSGLEGRLELAVVTDAAATARAVRRLRGDQDGIDAHGVQELGPFEPGEYILRLSLSTGRFRSRMLAEVPVVLVAGMNQGTIAIPPLYTVTVRTQLEKGTSLRLRKVGTPGSLRDGVQVDAEGVAVFDAIAAGEYQIVERNRFGRAMAISVPEQTDVEYKSTEPNAVSVTVSEPEGALAKAGFQSGDLIVGADGQEFESMLQMMGVVQRAISGGTVRFEVVRGTERLQVDIEAATMNGPDIGGQMQPVTR